MACAVAPLFIQTQRVHQPDPKKKLETASSITAGGGRKTRRTKRLARRVIIPTTVRHASPRVPATPSTFLACHQRRDLSLSLPSWAQCPNLASPCPRMPLGHTLSRSAVHGLTLSNRSRALPALDSLHTLSGGQALSTVVRVCRYRPSQNGSDTSPTRRVSVLSRNVPSTRPEERISQWLNVNKYDRLFSFNSPPLHRSDRPHSPAQTLSYSRAAGNVPTSFDRVRVYSDHLSRHVTPHHERCR